VRRPTIVRSGGRLTCHTGTWSGSPTRFAFGCLANGHAPRRTGCTDGVRAAAIASVVAATAVLVGASCAQAQDAKFRASLSGTYTTYAKLANPSCFSVDANGNTVPFTQLGVSSERDTFSSTHAVTLDAQHFGRASWFGAGELGRFSTLFLLKRTSSAQPQFCTPDEQYHPRPSDCGRRRMTYPIRVYGRTDRAAFSFEFNGGASQDQPDDPYAACPSYGARWPGALESTGSAPVSVGRLFDRNIHSLVLHGHAAGSLQDAGSATGRYELLWTLKLTRKA
jgi:hypothetical protein